MISNYPSRVLGKRGIRPAGRQGCVINNPIIFQFIEQIFYDFKQINLTIVKQENYVK